MSTHIRGVGIFAAHLFIKMNAEQRATRTLLTALMAKSDVNILRVRRREGWDEGYASSS